MLAGTGSPAPTAISSQPASVPRLGRVVAAAGPRPALESGDLGGMPTWAPSGPAIIRGCRPRLLLPTATATNIGFFIHYVLAGLFTYLLLRSLRVSWSGSVVAGVAYQLSGIMASYVQPGTTASWWCRH
jgi:hypothetical protein